VRVVDLVFVGLLAAVVALALHAVFIAPRRLRLTEADAPIENLPAALDGYTIGILSDIHHGSFVTRRNAARAVAMINAGRPDLVVLLGDFGVSFKYAYTPSRGLYRRMFGVLGRTLRCIRAHDGVLAILGNHDHYYNSRAVVEWLRTLGIRVLENEHIIIERGNAALAVGGVGDLREGLVDPCGGLSGAPEAAPRIVLSHNPDGVLRLARDIRVDLVLSGHTHGGQVVFPLYGAPLRFARVCGRHTACGWVLNHRAPLFVSCGVGVQIPLRFACPPEVVLMRLRRATEPTLGIGNSDDSQP
jgi:predicted MPP superfamily phosphohydrolase